MPPKLAEYIFLSFSIWLIYRDRKQRKGISNALWVPFLWVFILGSRPISTWLGGSDIEFKTSEDALEGSPTDRLLFLLLIGAGFFILWRRQLNWGRIMSDNRWLFAFYFYLGLSVVWSDYSFVSLKRWFKDFGNVIMALIILSEANPTEALEAVLAWCAYLLLPLSVLFIKYFPDLGRYADRWTGLYHYCGVTTNKNILGMTLFVCGLFVFWSWLQPPRAASGRRTKTELFTYLVLLIMTAWLLHVTQSSTALTCTVLGGGLVLAMRRPSLRSKVNQIGFYGVTFAIAVLLLNSLFDLGEVFVGLLGRDMTFTGRTDIWHRVLSEKINPLFGVGFYSFWLGDRPERLSRGYWYHLNEAHNGYLETYLNSGLIGVFLLLAMLVAGARRLSNETAQGSRHSALWLSFVLATAIYNLTEAVFNRLGLLWFVLILVITHYRRPLARAAVAPAPASAPAPSAA